MSNKIYEPGEAKLIAKRKQGIELARKNKKATSRCKADDIKSDMEMKKLLEHSDRLWFEELLSEL